MYSGCLFCKRLLSFYLLSDLWKFNWHSHFCLFQLVFLSSLKCVRSVETVNWSVKRKQPAGSTLQCDWLRRELRYVTSFRKCVSVQWKQLLHHSSQSMMSYRSEAELSCVTSHHFQRSATPEHPWMQHHLLDASGNNDRSEGSERVSGWLPVPSADYDLFCHFYSKLCGKNLMWKKIWILSFSSLIFQIFFPNNVIKKY